MAPDHDTAVRGNTPRRPQGWRLALVRRLLRAELRRLEKQIVLSTFDHNLSLRLDEVRVLLEAIRPRGRS